MRNQAAIKEIPNDQPQFARQRPLDLVHLAKQTLGDRSLETQVLRLFLTQSDLFMSRVEAAKTMTDRFAAAHTIKGSARNIGAWAVADAAEHMEAAEGEDVSAEIVELKLALRETCDFIVSILDDAA